MSIKYNNSLVIHGFALLHAATTLLCYATGIDDSIFLTVWTMAMTVLLCNAKRLSVEFTAVTVILVNIIGLGLGIAAAKGLELIITNPPVVHAISTFITTEALGWSIVFLVHKTGDETSTLDKTKWLWSAVIGILAARIIIGILSSREIFASVPITEVLSMVISNSAILLLLVCADIILLHRIHRGAGFKKRSSSVLWHIAIFLACPALCVLLMAVGIPVKSPYPLDIRLCTEIFVLTFITQAAIYSVIYLIYYVASTRRKMEDERTKGLVARMEYHNLKQQVNPHFLFNSLNILDTIVAQGKTAEARSFIRKLAQIYRYMLNNESEPLIPLSEELEYVNMYTDLLKVRFPAGIITETDVDAASRMRYVVKYSVQMLVENAYKHNSISERAPLIITIRADADRVTVSNNRHPKLSGTNSTGLGLKYIRKNYLANGGKDIEIIDSADVYSVSLPLL